MLRTTLIGTQSQVLAALLAAGVQQTQSQQPSQAPAPGPAAGGKMNPYREEFTVEQFVEELRRALRRPRGDVRVVSDQRGSVAGGPVVIRVASNLRVVVRTLRPEEPGVPHSQYPVYSVGYEHTSDTRVHGRRSATAAARMIARAYPGHGEHSLQDVIEAEGRAA